MLRYSRLPYSNLSEAADRSRGSSLKTCEQMAAIRDAALTAKCLQSWRKEQYHRFKVRWSTPTVFRSLRRQTSAGTKQIRYSRSMRSRVLLPRALSRQVAPRLYRTASSAGCVITNPGLTALFAIFIHRLIPTIVKPDSRGRFPRAR